MKHEKCLYCGGAVDKEGYAMGGVVGEGDVDAEDVRDNEVTANFYGLTDEPVEQGVAAERMRDEAFADSIRRRRRAR